ncbi:MAG: GFA family protein [Alphaproteobacteria bacterium]
MVNGIEGSCRCGPIRYRVAIDRQPPAYACHCHDCQTWSGSAFSMQFIAPEAALEVVGEPPPEDFLAALAPR